MTARLTLGRQIDGRWAKEIYTGDRSVFLDRLFLRNRSDDNFVPRSNHAPEVIPCRGGWLLFNRSETAVIEVSTSSGVPKEIGPGLLRWLEKGVNHLLIYGIDVDAEVSDEPKMAVVDNGPGPETFVEVSKQVAAVTEYIKIDELVRRGSLAARYQMYFHSGLQSRRPLTAVETAACFPALSPQQVHNIQDAIKYRTDLDLRDVGPFLRDNGIISSQDVRDLVHANCEHDWM